MAIFQAALGESEDAQTSYRSAIERFERLTQEEPANAEHFRKLAESYEGLARVVPDWSHAKAMFEKSRRAYSAAIERKPNDVSLYIRRGDIGMELADPRAVDDFEQASRLEPDNVKAHLACCWGYIIGPDLGPNQRKAREHAERAVAIAPDDPESHRYLAIALSSAGAGGYVVIKGAGQPTTIAGLDPEPILKHYARAIELAPDRAIGYQSRADFYARTGDYQRALSDVNRALKIDPHYWCAILTRAKSHAGLKQYDLALSDFATISATQPHSRYIYEECGGVHLAMGNYPAAIDLYSKALEIKPTMWHLYKRRAFAHFQLKHYDKALADIAKAVELNPGDDSNLSWIPPAEVARCPDERLREGLLELADKAIEKTKGAAEAYAARGILRHAFGHQEEALADFRKALELRPEKAGIWYQCALTQLAAKQTGEYQATCRRMVGQFSDGTAPADGNFIAWACTLAPDALSDWVQAVALAEKVAQSDPKSAFYLNTWGAVLYRAGRFDDALARLSEAEALVQPPSEANNSSPAYTWFFLAMTQHRLGHAEEAKQWLDKAVAWTDKIVAEADQGTTDLSVNRRLTLKLLREEAEQLLGTPDQPEDENETEQEDKTEAEG